MKNREFLLLMLPLLVLLAASGCGKKEAAEDKKLVAKINKCEITVEDFQDDVSHTLSNKYLATDPEKAKEDLLDEIIIKKMLLDEAQAKNFDKNKAFMKEIERYWEQALLKLLIKEKMRELLQQMSVKDDEIMKEYEKMKLEEGASVQSLEKATPMIRSDIKRRKVAAAFSQWILSLRKRAQIKVYKENLKTINID